MSDLDPHFEALREATEPDATRLARLRRGRPPRRRWPWAVGGLLAVGLAAAGLVWVRPAPLPPEPVGDEWSGESAGSLGPYVEVRADGVGAAEGSSRDVRVAWEAGSLEVDVQPGAGVRLVVTTGEATIEVIGTRFTVQRGPLGSLVSVAAGRVSVTCASGSRHTVAPTERVECVPTTPTGRLRRVTALQAAGRHEDVIREVGIALAEPAPRALALELELHRVAAWAAVGESPRARRALDRLDTEHPEAASRLTEARGRLER